ncbi:MAG: hypothetical protein OXC81_07180 [Betaproteobacteria bacterium]|nr:hypothetical protein [Betaproteobacteria bacterium]
MGMITDINIDQTGNVSAMVDGTKVKLDIHVLLMKVLANTRTRMTAQYLDEVNEMNRVNNKANLYRDLMEELRQAKSNGTLNHQDFIPKLQALQDKYGEDLFNDANFDMTKYGSKSYGRTEFLNQEELAERTAELDFAGIEYNTRGNDPGFMRHFGDADDIRISYTVKLFEGTHIDPMIEDLRHKITSMNNLNSQNQIKVKMIEQFRNETIEWQKSLLDKLDRLFQKVNQ